MPRGRKKKDVVSKPFLEALRFIACAQRHKGNDGQTHCVLQGWTATAFDGILGAGVIINNDLIACPETLNLILAMDRCGEDYSLTQTGPTTLLVRSGDFQATIPCLKPGSLATAQPDAATLAVGTAVTDALRIVAPLAGDKAEHVLTASIQLGPGSAIATDRTVILEAWHGYTLPTVVLPKAGVTAVLKCGKELVAVGYGEQSMTFHFSDMSWIKTQLYKEQWPMGVTNYLDGAESGTEFPTDLLPALKCIAPFCKDGTVICNGNKVLANHNNAETKTISQFMQPRIYSIYALIDVCKIATHYSATLQDRTMFIGDKFRGCIQHQVFSKGNTCPNCGQINCDCIPF